MSIELPLKLPDFLQEIDGDIRVTGHRINLFQVLKEYNAGESAEGISIKLPTLKLSTIYKMIAFYLDHQPEIDAYLRKYRSDLEAQEAAALPPAISKAELLRRLEQIRLKANHAAEVSY